MKRTSLNLVWVMTLLSGAEAWADAAAPTVNKGDTAWMIVATLLVILMTIPGLALFYGGMVRAKNMLSVLMQVFVIFSLIGVLWAIYGYSVAFTEGNAFFGGFGKAFLQGITPDSLAATFSKGVAVPEFIYMAFQMTFAAITPALIVGAFAERVKFSAVLVFTVLWFSFAYLPIAHMVWYWAGPDAYTDAKAAEAAAATAGFIFQKGALDFAGGTVVHINAGIAGIVGALLVGKRTGYGRESMKPHSVTLTMVGASLLWVAGSVSTWAPTWKPTALPPWCSSTPCWRLALRPCPGLLPSGSAAASRACWAALPARWRDWWRLPRPAVSSAPWAASSWDWW